MSCLLHQFNKEATMPACPIASYTKSARLFALYQCLPRSEADAVSLTQLMQNYGDDPGNYTNERKI
ncbi:hypothetical protein Psyaliredsea_20380 [Psychrobacter alimentarius]